MANEPALPSRWLVSTQWLEDHLSAPDVVVVDGSFYLVTQKRDPGAEYLAAHIPGAVRFDIDAISDHSSTLPHMLPSAEAFSSAMRALGIGDGETLVVYDGTGLYSAPRVWWTFRAFGVRDVFILDGGFPKWKAEGRPIESGEVKRMPRHFTARLDHSVVAGVADVQKALASKSAQVVDARAAERFRGEAPEPRAGLRAGHMPGALNVPYTTLLQDGRLRPREELAAAFAAGGVDTDKPVITSCGSGVTAAILTFALDALGKEQTSVYDGSWTEWGSREDLPVAKG
jgi:thiosulfate/3-mercaptopyruvate sulfurtransferase